MAIYYVRHGESEFVALNRWRGFIDDLLTAKGVKQAYNLGNKIKDIKFDLVFSSPLIRTMQTAEIILSALPHEQRPSIITDNRIMEWYCGDLEGVCCLKYPDIENDFYGERKLYDYTGVESYEQVEHRVKSFLDELKTKYKNKKILVVAHGGIGRVVKAYFDGKPKFYRDYNEMKTCELIEYKF